jgi:peptide chain release factor 3
MKIEQERGISVTTAVMTFEYQNLVYNLLDTPGHEDFSEDTYRTLTAADSAIMVIDAAKGIESQTRKLFEVCRMRDIPIITFVNKMDREARDPFELIDEIADQLQLHVTPAMWPAGSGLNFRGAMHFQSDRFLSFGKDAQALDPTKLEGVLRAEELKQFRDEMDLARGGYPAFDLKTFREGHITPIFFGSALKHFGVKELIEGLGQWAPGPRAQATSARMVEPEESKVTGFVFKVQANMDPNHRDRVAFMRVCSGQFKRGMKLKQSGTGKVMSVHNPILFFAQSRQTVDEAWPGDIIGIPNHGVLRVGDTLTEGEDLSFTGIPNFAPEIVKRVRLSDPLKAKHLQRALESLAEEGVTQVFKPKIGAQWFVGVVGQLQLEVLASRIAAEYGLEVAFEQGMFETARWVSSDDPAELKKFLDAHQGNLADDRDGSPVFMAKSAWELRYVAERFPKISFTATRERHH